MGGKVEVPARLVKGGVAVAAAPGSLSNLQPLTSYSYFGSPVHFMVRPLGFARGANSAHRTRLATISLSSL
jgi:hypothetical protein